ncbi:MAG: TorF family putative porin, partial [Polynucleobacter victoriensis]
MKTYLTLSAIALAAAATLSSGVVMAADPAPAPEFTVAYNIGATSDYRVRGIKQNNSNPAVQGGIDIGH